MTIVNRLSKIKAISFDGDMTLWDFETLIRRALGHTLAELRAHFSRPAADRLTVEQMVEIRNDVAAELKGTTVDLEVIRLHAFRRTLEYVGCEDAALAEHLNTVYRERRFQDVELYPDVLPTLDVLGSRFSLGLLSNGNSHPDAGLEGRFSFVVFSQEAGAEKPDKRIFYETFRRADCGPPELLHVGDSLECDVGRWSDVRVAEPRPTHRIAAHSTGHRNPHTL